MSPRTARRVGRGTLANPLTLPGGVANGGVGAVEIAPAHDRPAAAVRRTGRMLGKRGERRASLSVRGGLYNERMGQVTAKTKIPETLGARARAHGTTYPYNVNARMTVRHYWTVLAIAELHDCGVSEAMRIALDEYAERHDLKPEMAAALQSLEPGADSAAARHAEDA